MATAKRDLTNLQVQGQRPSAGGQVIDLRDDGNPARRGFPRLLTIEQAAEVLNVSVRNVREHIYRRRLGIVKVGRLVRIEENELADFIERGRSTSM